MQFPNLFELILDSPITKGQFTILTNNGLGPCLSTSLVKLRLSFTEFTSRTLNSMEVLSRLRFFPELEILHVTGDLAPNYPVYLVIHPGIKISALYMYGSAMRLPIMDAGEYFRYLTFLEMDGLHQLQFRDYYACLARLHTMILRNEEQDVLDCDELEWLFPELRTLSVTLRKNRAESFIPLIFSLGKLVSLEIIGNFTDKMICGTSDPKPPKESAKKSRNSAWRKFRTALFKPLPYIFDLKSLNLIYAILSSYLLST